MPYIGLLMTYISQISLMPPFKKYNKVDQSCCWSWWSAQMSTVIDWVKNAFTGGRV